jgi:hypothetical protein
LSQVEDCSKKFKTTMKFFNFAPKGMKMEAVEPKDFFETWHLFCQVNITVLLFERNYYEFSLIVLIVPATTVPTLALNISQILSKY